MKQVKIKVFAAESAQKLEKDMNDWLQKEKVKLEVVDFIADGLDLAYNCLVVYRVG